MLGRWFHDLESLEAVAQDGDARRMVLRLAAVAEHGGADAVASALSVDEEFDHDTQWALLELAGDPLFLATARDYMRRTATFH
jgi:hypothetical protein